MDVLATVAALDRLYVQQKFAPLVNRYRVSTVGPDGAGPGDRCSARPGRSVTPRNPEPEVGRNS